MEPTVNANALWIPGGSRSAGSTADACSRGPTVGVPRHHY
ncbi:hypothetical protein TIFTF001_014811 [Ficus carica]|uniref:Uncharacterized protein n=1 Tax=Ficus carica TaxID=3494 RepID=A0AA88D8E9_FICCA|nr:hypothetical protein TIFTF001_014811 [Ficus carica]